MTDVHITISQVPDTGTSLLNVSFNVDSTDTSNVLPILVIDHSSSMRYAVENVIAGAQELSTNYLKSGSPQVVLVYYNTIATSHMITNLSQIEEINIVPNGMTNFSAALREIILWINRSNDLDLQARVYFMTDGCNTVSPESVAESEQGVRDSIARAKYRPTIDVIGFSHEHDVRFLNSLAGLSGEGTFQFADSKNSLQTIIGSLDAVSASKRLVTVSWKTDCKSGLAVAGDDGRLSLVVEGKSFCHKAIVHIVGYQEQEILLEHVKLDPAVRESYLFTNCHKDLETLVQKIGTTTDYQEFEQKIEMVDQRFDALTAHIDIFRNKTREQRNKFVEMHTEFKNTIRELHAACHQELSNSHYATMLTTCSSRITKNGLAKKLRQRKIQQENSPDQEVAKKVGKQLHFQNACAAPSDICILTLENYQELAVAGDCLCIGLSVSRNYLTIVNPGLCVINAIHPSLISFDGFRDAINIGTDLYGLAREHINAVFPLFYDYKSWSIAKLRIKEALSYMATGVWNGWDQSQLDILPYMFLVKAIKDYIKDPSEFRSTLVQKIKQVCQVLLDNKHSNRLYAFIRSPAYRTMDCTPSLEAIVGIAYTIDYNIDQKMQRAIWEEHFRRKLRQHFVNVERKTLYKRVAGLLRMPHNSPQWQWKRLILPSDIRDAKKALQECNEWFTSPLECPTDTQCLALTVQNMLQTSNTYRRQIIESGGYIDPFESPETLIATVGQWVQCKS